MLSVMFYIVRKDYSNRLCMPMAMSNVHSPKFSTLEDLKRDLDIDLFILIFLYAI